MHATRTHVAVHLRLCHQQMHDLYGMDAATDGQILPIKRYPRANGGTAHPSSCRPSFLPDTMADG
eukprot:8130936-Karenia_brevis.AAC.1